MFFDKILYMENKKQNVYIFETLKESWNIFIKNWKKILPVTVAFGVLLFLLSNIQQYFSHQWLSSFITNVLSFFVQIFITMGYLNMVLYVIRGKDFEWKNIYEKSNRFLHYIGATILVSIAMAISFVPSVLLMIVFWKFGDASLFLRVSMSVLSALFALASFVFVVSRLYFFQFFTIDTDLLVLDIVKTTWRSTKGKNMQIFSIIIFALILNILGMLAFGVGLLVSVPISVIMLGLVYQNVSGHINHDDSIVPEIRGEELTSGEDN